VEDFEGWGGLGGVWDNEGTGQGMVWARIASQQGLKPALIWWALRGPEGPRFHGAAVAVEIVPPLEWRPGPDVFQTR
jgi:hypothetical protein